VGGSLAGLAAVALPLVRSAAGSYQLSPCASLEPAGVLTRLAQQLGWHLGPLAAPPPLRSGRLALAAAAVASALVACPPGEVRPCLRLVRLAVAGSVSASRPGARCSSRWPRSRRRRCRPLGPRLRLMLAAATLLAASLLPAARGWPP
jgi:hypothetical protein